MFYRFDMQVVTTIISVEVQMFGVIDAKMEWQVLTGVIALVLTLVPLY